MARACVDLRPGLSASALVAVARDLQLVTALHAGGRELTAVGQGRGRLSHGGERIFGIGGDRRSAEQRAHGVAASPASDRWPEAARWAALPDRAAVCSTSRPRSSFTAASAVVGFWASLKMPGKVTSCPSSCSAGGRGVPWRSSPARRADRVRRARGAGAFGHHQRDRDQRSARPGKQAKAHRAAKIATTGPLPGSAPDCGTFTDSMGVCHR